MHFQVGPSFSRQFQSFDYSQPAAPTDPGTAEYNYDYPTSTASSYMPPPASNSPGYMGSIMTPDPLASAYTSPEDMENFDDEPPLLEELGINFDHIRQKTLAVLNPIATPDSAIHSDTDLAGPLVFGLLFGASLLLAGKVQFGYIYGIGVVGCMAVYSILHLMSLQGVSVLCVISVLGYCLLPMVLLSFGAVLLSLQGAVGAALTTVAVLWCSVSASNLFVAALAMDQQQLLVAYPCALVYGVFALLTVF
ncbi:hypothetical protein CAPTEDRAFT_168758 [Capitella teleta]|uniref:Protein YIPF n=1 Tax=Capitella teleta TaxID=283909 RepID=R7TIW2_CAPTE|nr:hypothetical protein CAPTEDRAFT_168758 [Capitella teleta]|eukprot:ELT91035.1 hypothetical protein CAPTEDRAFT_168758 [Capitella teleta]